MSGQVFVVVMLLAAFFVFALYAAARLVRRERSPFSRDPGMDLRGPGLRSRLALITMGIVLAVVCAVSFPLYLMMVEARHEALLRGLWDRSSVMLEVLSDSVAGYLRAGDVGTLGLFAERTGAVPEVRYVTVIGGTGVWDDVVWATGDPDIAQKIDTPELLPGVSRLREAHGPRLRQAGFDPGNWDGRSFSEPEFVFRYAPREPRYFVFFRPIAYDGPYGTRFQGFVKMGVGTGSVAEQLDPMIVQLRLWVLFAVFAAFAVSATGVLLHSTVAATRVRRLLNHARMVANASDERSLSRMEIRIRGQDEVAVLGNVFNNITQKLAKTAIMTNGLAAGKRLQRKLLPLEADKRGDTFDFSRRDVGNAVFFAYYEEAEEISGDYFDYRNLDDRYYAIIKCDVAGSGIPAALITMQVSTMFLSYFWTWDPGRMAHMDDLVYMINGFIERMGASRRFAAFTFCIYDSETGRMNFCNAGDNIVRIFDASERRVRSIVLPESPAAGILENGVVETEGGGYGVHTLYLDPGDVLLLYTDGLEESRRRYRGPVFDGKACTVGVNRANHGNYIAGQWGEALGTGRIHEVIDAVANGGTYRLRKCHTPDGREEYLHFDFSGCRGGVEEIVLALASVEKMFRCYRAPGLTGDDRVSLDSDIDAFLAARLLEYRGYFAHAGERPVGGNHVYYTHLREDYRHDDMAIIGVERKPTDRGEENT